MNNLNDSDLTNKSALELPSFPSTRDFKCEECYLPRMSVTRLEEDLEVGINQPVSDYAPSIERSKICDGLKGLKHTERTRRQWKNSLGIKLPMQHEQAAKRLRDGIPTCTEANSIKHSRNCALSGDVFEASIIPNLLGSPRRRRGVESLEPSAATNKLSERRRTKYENTLMSSNLQDRIQSVEQSQLARDPIQTDGHRTGRARHSRSRALGGDEFGAYIIPKLAILQDGSSVTT